MMVVMALTTTFMTSPLLNLIDRIFKKKEAAPLKIEKKYKVLVSFDNPRWDVNYYIWQTVLYERNRLHLN